MTPPQIRAIQTKIGTEADGFWGPKSVAACQAYLRGLMPPLHPFPAPTQMALKSFYGDPGKGEIEPQLVGIDVKGLGLQYDGRPVATVRVHAKAAASLKRILTELAAAGLGGVLAQYAGVYNHRPMRGGANWSLHAYGAAIDLAPHNNGLHTHWPTKATMPLEVMEIFAREGWLPAGAFWSRDSMHFQSSQ
jgi:hypothetical protein